MPTSFPSAATISSSTWRRRAGTNRNSPISRVLRVRCSALIGHVCGSCQPRRGREVELVRRPCRRSRASRGAARSGLAHLFGSARARWGLSRPRSPVIPVLPHEHASNASRLAGSDRGLQGDPSRCARSSGRPACASVWPKRSARTAASSRRLPTRPIRRRSRRSTSTRSFRSAISRRRNGTGSSKPITGAHPRRLLLLKERERSRRLTLMLPDLGSEQKNHKLDALLSEFAEKVARLIEDT
mgnify:CR=1 FL=1